MTHALEVAVLVEELMPLLEQLYDLLPEPMANAGTGTMSHHKALGSPAPWHAEAGFTLYTIAEEARRLEASLRLAVAGHPGIHRGGSDANTIEALKAITELVHAVPDVGAREVSRIVSRWVRWAGQVSGIDLEDRPRGLSTVCPYCCTYGLRVLPHGTDIWCINRECTDRDGRQPRGRLDRSNLTGDPMIIWTDGRLTRRRDLA